MNIVCPQCGFSRPLPAERADGHAVIATCPRCACRFRFFPGNGEREILGDTAHARTAAAATPARPTPPPGAVIPGQGAVEDAQAGSDSPPEAAPSRAAGRPGGPGEPYGEAGAPSASGEASSGETSPLRPDPPSPAEGEDGAARDGIPWDSAPDPDGWIAAFYRTCLGVLFGATKFFASLRPDAAQQRPLAFYLLIALIQAVVERLWADSFLALLAPNAATDPELTRMLAALTPQISLPLQVLLKAGVALVQLYALAVLLRFFYSLVLPRRRPEFALVFQVVAYAAAPGLLCVVPLLGSLAGTVWMLACLLVGCRTALRMNWGQTLLGFLPVMLLLGFALLRMAQMASV